MSSLIVPVTTIQKLMPHRKADELELAHVLGWQLVVPRDLYQEGDKIVYFPIDTILPVEVSDKFGVTKYLSNQRIRCARLRGEPSFGLVVPLDDQSWPVGMNVAEHYGATKYEPPLRVGMGNAEQAHPLFFEYTEIENMRNFPTLFTSAETVVLTEKIHGTNCRVGLIEGELMAGSKAVRRKRPDDDAFASNLYWYPLSLEPVRTLLEQLGTSHQSVELFGEVYGSKIQSLNYGELGTLGFRAFDLLVDGVYLDWSEFTDICKTYAVPTVPVIATIPYDLAEVRRLSEGKTLLMKKNVHLREGLVVRPLHERTDPKVGRVILKYLSDSYLLREKTDYMDQ